MCLARDDLRDRISVVATDDHARFMWIQIRVSTPPRRDIYIAVCYFPPISSSFSIHSSDDDPFTDLYSDITKYSVVGDIIIMGDFNAQTRDLQIPIHDRTVDVFYTRGVDPTSMNMHRTSEDSLGPMTAYGKHLL